MFKRYPASLLLASAVLVIGCNVGPDYKTPASTLPAEFSAATEPAATQFAATSEATATTEAAATTQPVIDLSGWWKTFNDPQLDALIVRAEQYNLDLRAARARILQARAQRIIAGAPEYPQVNVDGSYTHSKTSQTLEESFFGGAASAGGAGGAGASSITIPGLVSDVYQAGFDATWEIDIFGGTRRGVEAATDDLAASIEDRRDTLVTLLSEVAVNYVNLRGYQRQLALAYDNLNTQRQTLELTKTRFKVGITGELDVVRAQAQVSSTEADVPVFVTEIDSARRALAVLLGQTPEALDQELAATAPIPVGPAQVPPGLPSELLRRRPDIRRAERQFAAARARIGVATANLYPQFSLTGSFGQESAQFKQLFDVGSNAWSIGPAVNWPIFDAGAIRANITVQNALQEQALVAYQKTVLNAVQDVENALTAHRQEQLRRKSLIDAVAANERAVDLSNQLYAHGLIDFLTVLDAERTLFAAQDELAQSDRTVSTNLVAIYKSLGGGWEPRQDLTRH